MGTGIRTRIIKIGNSQGIRIPKILLEQSGIGEEVEIEVQESGLVIRAVSQPRIGWNEAFVRMAQQQDDVLLDNIPSTDWENLEWEW